MDFDWNKTEEWISTETKQRNGFRLKQNRGMDFDWNKTEEWISTETKQRNGFRLKQNRGMDFDWNKFMVFPWTHES
ncbi:hypothetical protein BgiBS90_012228 [Biomphalaria glabrata]|nr:hypothetical protein BgiBS90_012228 [Biomphalaria glabrata]